MNILEEKLQRTSDDIVILYTEEEQIFRKKLIVENTDTFKWKCTICNNTTSDTPYPHRVLKVLVCFNCLNIYDNAIFLANRDGTDKNCRWCAKSAKKFTCSRCTVIFCKNCIEQNFDSDYARRVGSINEWNCFICDPKPIWRLRGECSLLLEKIRNNDNGYHEVTEMCIQDSDNLSKLVNGETHNQSISENESEIASPTKLSKPISASDDDEENSYTSDTEFSTMLEEIEEKFNDFGSKFCDRISMIPEKQQNAKTVQQRVDLIQKLDLLCSLALDNIQDIQTHINDKHTEWQNKVQRKEKTEINNIIKDPKQSRRKNNKFDLSLKTLNENNNITVGNKVKMIEMNEEHKKQVELESGTILNKIDNLNNSPITPPNSSPISPATCSSISEYKIEDIPVFPKQTARKKTGGTLCKVEETRKSARLKTESKEHLSNFSTDIKIEKYDLSARIEQDFGDDTDSEGCVKIETYLCEKTGEFCQSYYTVYKNLIKEEISDDSEKTINYDWKDLKIKSEDIKDEKESNYIKTFNKIDQKEKETNSDSGCGNSNNLSESIIERDRELALQALENITTSNKRDQKENGKKSNLECDDSNNLSESFTERDRELALQALEKDLSDVDSLSLSSSSSSLLSTESGSEEEAEPVKNKGSPHVGYVMNLNIAAEIAKLQKTLHNDEDSSAKESDGENDEYDYKLDHKFKMKPIVLLETMSANKLNYTTNENNTTDNDSDEINRLTNLDTLKRKLTSHSSDDNSSVNSERKHKKLRKKKKMKSQVIISDSSSDSSKIKSDSENDGDVNLLNDKLKEDHIINAEDFLKDDQPVSENDDVEVIEDTSEKTVKKVKNKESKKCKDVDKNSKWRNNTLLVGNLNPPKSSDTDETNDSVANEILEKEEENYLQNADKNSVKRKRSDSSVEEISSSSEDDLIIVSDNTVDSTDSDVCFVDVNNEDGRAKKGRRNIKELLKDDQLKEETRLADKEESERKERITLKQKTLESLLSESQLSQEEVGMVLEMDETTKTPVVTVHHSLVKRLKKHQESGIKFMWSVCFESVSEIQKSKGVGCILAHCMGLGKTMQVVVLIHTLLNHKQTNVKHVLIICPLSTVLNWKNEFTQTLKVCPTTINVFYINPDRQKNYKQKMFEVKRWKNNGGVLLMGYESYQCLVSEEKLQKFEESFKKTILESLVDPGPELIVCDEGHMLKNGKTIRFSSLNRIKTKRRIILTGTPLQNNLIEYYYMVNFVKPHLLGTLEEYKNRFVNPILNGQYEDSNRDDIHLMKRRSHILHKKLETTVQRYEEAELIPYLPEKHDYVLFVQLTPLQILLYEYYLGLLDVTTKKLFKNYHALQNIWTHPALLQIKYEKKKEPSQKKQKRYDEVFVPDLDPDTEDSCLGSNWFKDMMPEDVMSNISYGIKMELLFSVIKECTEINDKLLVFSSSIAELDLIEHFLKNLKDETWIKDQDYYRMDGTVAPERRMNICNNFNNEKNKRARLFLVSHKVGGLGLNLIAANRVILMDVSWNPAYDIQSVFRVYRFGQKKTCYIYRFVSMGTMEEVVYSRAVTKLAVAGRVVDEHQIKRHFNSDDLQKMYRLEKNFGDPPTLTLPSDRLLATIWDRHKPHFFKFSDHKSLLENLAHEELNAEEIKEAWDEFKSLLERENFVKEMANSSRLAMLNVNNNSIPPMTNVVSAPSAIRYPMPSSLPQVDRLYKRPIPLPSRSDLLGRIRQQFNSFGASTSAMPGPSTSATVDLTLDTTQRSSNYGLQPNPQSALNELLTRASPTADTLLMDYLLSVRNQLNSNGVQLVPQPPEPGNEP